MKKRLLTLITAAVLSVSVLAGCGTKTEKEPNPDTNKEPEKIALTVWVPENQVKNGTIDAMTKSFAAANPKWDITFKIEVVGEDVAKEQVLRDVQAAGDVFFFANDQLPELVNAGAIAKLGGSTEQMVKSTMADTVVDTVTIDNAIYGIPFTHNTYFMYYDKSLLTENDITSVEKILAVNTEKDVYNFVFDSAGGWKLGSWYYGAGLHIYGDTGADYAKGTDWNSAKGLAVTNYLIDLINNPKVAYNDDISVVELAASHKVGAWFDGAWNYDDYKKALGDDLGLAALPTFNPDGNDYALKAFYGSKAIGVNAHSKHMEAAVALAAYLGSEEMQVKRFEESNQIPTNTKAGAAQAVQSDDIAVATIAVVQKGSVMQPISAEFSSRYWDNAGAIATEIRNGKLTKANAQERLNLFVENMTVK